MRVLGMLSGTSHDGIDLAVVDFDRVDEDGLRGSVVWTGEVPYSAATRRLLVEALPPARTTMEAVCRIDVSVGREFASAAAGAIAAAGPVEVICSHGQTVYHGVEDGAVWGTLQIGQPAWIAEETGIPVIADVRTRDVAAGGQGAPLVPLLDGMLAAREKTPVAFLNLGGIANATIVDAAGASVAYDIGPANALIDAAMSAHPTSPAPYDADGAAAARGTIDPALLDLLMDDPFYRLAPPKSTGKELFNAAYVAERAGGVAGDDLVATLTELTARVVARDLRAHGVARVVVSGGGIRNPVLSARLRALLDPATVETSDALGIPADSKEAIAFALIGWFTVNGLPANVPAATGARGGRVLGSIVPGAGPLPPADGGRRPSWISFGEPA